MKFSRFNLLLLGLILSLATFTSCGNDDDEVTTPITIGSSVTVSNTFQSIAFTMGVEGTVEELSGLPAGSLFSTANVGDGLEFSAYLLGLYDIEIEENSISFEVVSAEDNPSYADLWRVYQEGTFDRYYFTFDTAQNVSGFTSTDPSVNLRIDSDKVLVVENGEGFDFKPGQKFTITLN